MSIKTHLKVELEQPPYLHPIRQRRLPLKMSLTSLKWTFVVVHMNFLAFLDGFKGPMMRGKHNLMLIDPRHSEQ